MKTSNKPLYCLIIALMAGASMNAQFLKKLAKKAESAAERTIERRVENETSKKTDQALDSILEPGSGDKKAPDTNPPDNDNPSNTNSGNVGNPSTGKSGQPAAKSITVYSKFDYVPGDKLLFFDDFANDFIGDFPSKWNTNGGGEVVTTDQSSQKWLKLIPGYSIYYLPNIPDLPEEYTIEFDLLTNGIDGQTSSTAGMEVLLSDDKNFEKGDHHVEAFIPVGQYALFSIGLRNYIRGEGSPINSDVRSDIREAVLNQPHISIAVNKARFRLWVNEIKYVDIPKMVPEHKLTSLKFNVNGIKDGKEQIFISNLKVAEGGVDLRRKLISEGKVSTNGILFDVGSANIQPQSMGIILQISQVLKQETAMKLNIVGHTDSDGSDESNLKLSKERAEAVKNALVSVYGISSDRLSSEGKGESTPVEDNSTPAGKAQNRRVEFIKI
ncbi:MULTISPECIES: OmpA family protein [Flagellimonas]|uniref:OmpA family protein n=1 Tax=Flagellimonas hadalis TaxID=2597517 RepID=A0A5N5ITL2_9FLAO|nr:OmpA family protein [Allomuricauda hadalis]KAB5489543.1 OmpA family protein [Allomuricauda hadalis]RUA14548.1 MAG: OmpA family protein [Flavobacteriia bacterium]